eukprot:Sro1286_g259420.2  (524) ;mRNA; r:27650-29221
MSARQQMMQKQESARWISQQVSPKKKEEDYWDKPICFRMPQPSYLKPPAQPQKERWAVHPRVVYGKPKTTKAVQPNRWTTNERTNSEEQQQQEQQPQQTPPLATEDPRWAATAPGKKKKPVFPQNVSRWAAQPKKKKLPENAVRRVGRATGGAKATQRKPQRQNTQEGPDSPKPTQRKPQRQTTQEGPDSPKPTQRKPQRQTTQESRVDEPKGIPKRQPTQESVFEKAVAARRSRKNVAPPSRRRSVSGEQVMTKEDEAAVAAAMAAPNSMPMVDRSDKTDERDDNQSCEKKERKKVVKLLNRSMSLGEVKRIVSATRIQSFARMFLQRYRYELGRKQQRKDQVEKETQDEIAHIQECLKLRLQSIRDKMERENSMGLAPAAATEASGDDDAAASLRTEIAALEAVNSKLQSQCDRLRATNSRVQGGNKTREAAVKEVSARLKKLQHIHKKLNKVYGEFQVENKTIQAELDKTCASLKKEHVLQERTKKCIRQIVTHVRSKQGKENVDLMEELEDTVPVDCLM